MNDAGARTLGRRCREQAALTTSPEVREVLLQMAEKYESESEAAVRERRRQSANDSD